MTRYTVVTAYDIPIHGQPSFDTRAAAVRWAIAHADEFPGLKVLERTVVTTERTVWRNRLREIA